jgi:DNA repair exonuclease SbcCD nuclease subunit
MKFIHIADIVLDQSCAAMELPPNLGNEHRAHLQTIMQRILNRARDWQADALFITGNLFDHERVTRNTISFLREAFAALAPMPVFLCAGRYDPAIPGSPYLTEPWSANVHIFSNPDWRALELPGLPLTVHGFGWNGTPDQSMPDNLLVPEDGRVHVALGHGLETRVRFDGDAGIGTFDPPLNLPGSLAYLGLGGLPEKTEMVQKKGVPVWYPGTPENCQPGESGSYGHLEIEIGPRSKKSGPVTVQHVPLSTGRFHAFTLDCTPYASGQELLDAIRAELLPRRDHPLIRVVLEGSLLRQIYEELDGIRDILGEEVHFLQWRENCQVGDDYTTIAGERTSLGAFVQRISAEIEDAPSDDLKWKRQRSRDLGVCAYRATPLPIKGLTGDYR